MRLTLSPLAALQFFYAKLQALAFEEDFFDPMKTEDKTKPLVEGMHQASSSKCRPLAQYTRLTSD